MKDIRNNLIRSMREERKAIRDYTNRMRYAHSKGDARTVKIYQHIINEEKQHWVEFGNRIRQIINSK